MLMNYIIPAYAHKMKVEYMRQIFFFGATKAREEKNSLNHNKHWKKMRWIGDLSKEREKAYTVLNPRKQNRTTKKSKKRKKTHVCPTTKPKYIHC